jgi:hypothetical protein
MGAVATVKKKSFRTLRNSHPAQMPDEFLADIVILTFKKLSHYLEHIRELKSRFDIGDRDSKNHLKIPIKGCHSWAEFCERHLDHTPQAVGKAIGRKRPVISTGDCFVSFSAMVRRLSPFLGDGNEHKFIEAAEQVMTAPIKDPTDVESIIRALKAASEIFLEYAERLEKRLTV